MDLYIGLGSNLGHREANIRRAISLLSSLIGPLVRASTLIETDPVDMDSDHKFLNAVPSLKRECIRQRSFARRKCSRNRWDAR